MARLLLNSTVLIDALRGRPAAQRVAGLRRVQPWTCAISVEEIWRGLRSDEEPVAARLFNGLRIAPLGVAEGQLAGSWHQDFARRGTTLHQADCLFAAAAVGIGATLATANIDDFPMDGLAGPSGDDGARRAGQTGRSPSDGSGTAVPVTRTGASTSTSWRGLRSSVGTLLPSAG